MLVFIAAVNSWYCQSIYFQYQLILSSTYWAICYLFHQCLRCAISKKLHVLLKQRYFPNIFLGIEEERATKASYSYLLWRQLRRLCDTVRAVAFSEPEDELPSIGRLEARLHPDNKCNCQPSELLSLFQLEFLGDFYEALLLSKRHSTEDNTRI